MIDCANGAAYQVGPKVFRELGAEVEAIGVTPDGLNINEGFGSTDPNALMHAVISNQAILELHWMAMLIGLSW